MLHAIFGVKLHVILGGRRFTLQHQHQNSLIESHTKSSLAQNTGGRHDTRGLIWMIEVILPTASLFRITFCWTSRLDITISWPQAHAFAIQSCLFVCLFFFFFNTNKDS